MIAIKYKQETGKIEAVALNGQMVGENILFVDKIPEDFFKNFSTGKYLIKNNKLIENKKYKLVKKTFITEKAMTYFENIGKTKKEVEELYQKIKKKNKTVQKINIPLSERFGLKFKPKK